ncbi:TonB-dependent receptor plug domain-containing protein [Pseudoduganella violaceinigra]|uniref:TonB-dependent receptor plug domain-containing protein n=1 Tax=Pseudoduganella violaceinigra TaxID=246602 RepID=UPI00041C5C1B|nr:TonB-dependent receptor [Pseudoduganella violaceinigra]
MIRLTLVAAAILSATQAMAEEKKEEPVQKVEIKGAAQAYNPRKDDTASKIIVSSEELKRYGDASIGDALKRVPGVTVGAGGRDIRMRGLGSGYTQILLNGERVPAGFNIETLAPDSIERIEVIRAASAEFSTQSIAGTINIVLKKAVQTAQREVNFGVTHSREANNPRGNLILSDKDGNFSYSVNVGGGRYFFERDSFTDDELIDLTGQPRMARRYLVHDHGYARGIELSPRLNWTLENGDTVTSQSFINKNTFVSNSDRAYRVAVGDAPFYDSDRLESANRNLFGRSDLNWVHKFGEGAKLDAKIGGKRMRSKSQWFETDAHAGEAALQHNVFSGIREWGVSSTGKYSSPIGSDHSLAAGWEAGYTSRDDWRNQRDLFSVSGVRSDKDEGYLASVRNLAAYVQDEWSISKAWSVYGGLRWEGLLTRSSGAGFDPVNNRSAVWSPLMQTLYKLPNGKDQLRAALTRTYKAPQASVLSGRRFTSTNNSQTDTDFVGNPGLKPELATGIDTSYEHYWNEGAMFSVAAASRRINNFTRRNTFLDSGGRWVTTTMNNGRADVRSLDVELKFPMKAVMDNAPALDVRTSVSRNWSRVESVPGPDNTLDQQVPLSATFGLDYKTPDGKWSMGGSFNYRGNGLVRMDVNRYSWATPARQMDAYIAWKVDGKTTVRFSGWNLLKQDYRARTTFIRDNGQLASESTSTGVCNIRLQVESRF